MQLFISCQIIVARATKFSYCIFMRKKLGPAQHKAWAYLITRHSKIFGRIERALESNKALLPLHHYDVLLALKNSSDKKLRLIDVAEEIVTSKSALSRSVEKLEKLGFLIKEKSPDDGRSQFAAITPKGLKALADTWPHYEAAIEEYFGRFLTAQEAKQLTEIMHKFD